MNESKGLIGSQCALTGSATQHVTSTQHRGEGRAYWVIFVDKAVKLIILRDISTLKGAKGTAKAVTELGSYSAYLLRKSG